MAEDLAEGDQMLAQLMTQTSQRIVAHERPYDVSINAQGSLRDLIGKASHDGAAYILWAEISDLVDSPWGPQSESACNDMAAAVAEDWLSIDAQSPQAVASYFVRWKPATGSSWLARQFLSTSQPSSEPT